MTNYLQMTNKDLDTKAWKLLWLSKRQIIRKKQKYKREWNQMTHT
jgi:hypothetical protein